MKFRLPGLLALVFLVATSAYASDSDKPEETDVDKARRYLQQQADRPVECARLKQLEAEARRASYDENDPRPKNDRLREQLRLRQEIQAKCTDQ